MTTKQEGKGQRIVKVTPEFLEDIFARGASFESNLPNDARLLECFFSETDSWNYWMKFESSEWEPLDEGEQIPFFEVRLDQSRCNNERIQYYIEEKEIDEI